MESVETLLTELHALDLPAVSCPSGSKLFLLDGAGSSRVIVEPAESWRGRYTVTWMSHGIIEHFAPYTYSAWAVRCMANWVATDEQPSWERFSKWLVRWSKMDRPLV
jgi:hypothetical protein